MILSIENKSTHLIYVSIILALFSLLIHSYNFIVLLGIIGVMTVYYFGKNAVLILILFNYLTSLTEYLGNLRVYLNLFATMTLLYMFLKEFGFKFNEYPKVPNSIISFVLFFLTTLIISTLFSDFVLDGIGAIIRTSVFFIICYMFYSLIKNIQTVYLYILGIIISFVALSLRMFYDLITLGLQDFFIKSILKDNTELTGSVGYTNFTIFFISITLLSAIILSRERFIKNKTILSILLSLNIFALIFANARAAIVAAILSNIFLFFIFKRNILIKTFFSSILIVALLYFLVPEIESTIDFYLRIDTINQRDMFWRSGFSIIKRNPIIGIGPETFPRYFFTYAPSFLSDYLDLKIWNYRPTPHSTFLLQWAENGILGLFSVIFLFILYFYFGIKSMIKTKLNNEYFLISAAITGIGFGILFRAFFEVTGVLQYGFITTDLPFWILFLIAVKIYQLPQSELMQN